MAELRRTLVVILLGFFLRAPFLASAGTQDMEWWKAWSAEIQKRGALEIYGSSDKEVLQKIFSGETLSESLQSAQHHFRYESDRYSRKEFTFVQPPLYIAPLWIAGKVIFALGLKIDDSRAFNVVINLINCLLQLPITFLLYYIAKASVRCTVRPSLLVAFFWLSPLTIQNSPVQGYLDGMIMTLGLASVFCASLNRYGLALSFAACSFLTKPQGIFIFPIIILAAFLGSSSLKGFLRCLLWPTITILFVLLPYFIGGHSLSLIYGVASIYKFTKLLSYTAMNFWWPAQVIIANTRDSNWLSGVQIDDLPWGGAGITGLSLLLLTAFTIMNCFSFYKTNADKRAQFIYQAAYSQIMIFYCFSIGLHENHYITSWPLLVAAIAQGQSTLISACKYSALFFIWNFIFYGFGRDGKSMAAALDFFPLPALTSIMAFYWTYQIAMEICVNLYRNLKRPINESIAEKSQKI